MSVALASSRGIATLAICLGLAGCIETGEQQDGLYYRPPPAAGQAFAATRKTPAEVAQILRDAGLGDVRSDTGSVTLASRDLRLIDCGTMIQVTMGNRAEFPANAPVAVLMEGFVNSGLIQRGIASTSTVRLTRLADGRGYAIAESHSVTRRYEAVDSRARSSASISFDETSQGNFPDKTLCRSSGLIGKLLR